MRASPPSGHVCPLRTSRGGHGDAPRMAGSAGQGRSAPIGAPASVMICVSELEPGASGHHRRSPGIDCCDDLLGVDPLEVDRGRAEVDVPELALDDVQRHSLARELDRMGMASLVRREPTPYPGPGGETAKLAAHRSTRPRPAARRPVDDAEHRPDWQLDARGEPRPELLPAPVAQCGSRASSRASDDARQNQEHSRQSWESSSHRNR